MKHSLINWWSAVCREPYRLFFPLGVLMGAVGIGHWLFYALHWLPRYSVFFHSSIQMLVYMNCFVIGFLMTAIPRFTSTHGARSWEVLGFLFLLGGMVLCFSLEKWIVAEGIYVAWLIFLMIFVGRRIAQRVKTASAGGNKPPYEMVWLPLGILAGVIGTALLILGQSEILPRWALSMGKPMMEQGFLLCVILGIGGFLVPRLMGTYALAATAGHSEELFDQPHQPVVAQSPVFLYLFLFLLFLASFVFEGLKNITLAYGLRALVMTIVFVRTHVIPGPPKIKDFYVRLVWVSVWMVLTGLWGAAVWPDYQIVWLHVMFIGGLSLMTFAIASMVIMTHAGEGDKLQKPLWIFWMVGLGLAMVALKRAAVVFFPDQYFQFLGIAAAIWLIVAISWFVFILPRIFKIPDEDEFGKLHEEAIKKKA